MDSVSLAFESALRLALPDPKPSRRRATLQLLGGKITRGAINHWRKGRRKPPRWARELLAAELLRDNAKRAAVAEMLLSEKEKAPD